MCVTSYVQVARCDSSTENSAFLSVAVCCDSYACLCISMRWSSRCACMCMCMCPYVGVGVVRCFGRQATCHGCAHVFLTPLPLCMRCCAGASTTCVPSPRSYNGSVSVVVCDGIGVRLPAAETSIFFAYFVLARMFVCCVRRGAPSCSSVATFCCCKCKRVAVKCQVSALVQAEPAVVFTLAGKRLLNSSAL